MSLVRNGPHTVDIFVQETVEDFRGNIVERASETKVTISGCFVQPVASARGAFAALKVSGDGQDVLVAYKLLFDPSILATTPLDWWSKVEWIDEYGVLRRFSCLGGPQPRNFSSMTRHVSVTLQEER